jgi:hypothetical protein
MATNEKNGLTYADALKVAIESVDREDVKEKLGKLLTRMSKGNKTKGGETEAHKRNAVMADKVVALMEQGKAYRAKDIIDLLAEPSVQTTQKAVVVMNIALADGRVAIAPKTKKSAPVMYVLAA